MEKLHYDSSVGCCDDADTGGMFPDLLNLVPNCVNRGRVFSVFVESHGVGTARPQMNVDNEAWARCFESPRFERCYRLSMAKLLLQQALY